MQKPEHQRSFPGSGWSRLALNSLSPGESVACAPPVPNPSFFIWIGITWAILFKLFLTA